MSGDLQDGAGDHREMAQPFWHPWGAHGVCQCGDGRQSETPRRDLPQEPRNRLAGQGTEPREQLTLTYTGGDDAPCFFERAAVDDVAVEPRRDQQRASAGLLTRRSTHAGPPQANSRSVPWNSGNGSMAARTRSG